MRKGDKKSLNGIELFLCPFENLYITCGPNESKFHKGVMAWDVSGTQAQSYFAPATSKCLKLYPESGQSMWQTIGNVRCPNGYVGIVTYMIVHDNDISDLYVGKIVNQGERLGEFGDKGNADGQHCHIEFSQGSDTSWFKNKYGNYMFNNEVDPEDVLFMDNTNILNGMGNWRYTDSLYIGKPIERDTNKEQIRVFTDKFYPTGRKTPMGYISGFVKEGIYNVLETRVENNLTWYRIEDELWFDYGQEWSKVLLVEDTDKVEYLKQRVAELEEMNKLVMIENEQLLTENVALRKENEELRGRLDNQPSLVFTAPSEDYYAIRLKNGQKLYIK